MGYLRNSSGYNSSRGFSPGFGASAGAIGSGQSSAGNAQGGSSGGGSSGRSSGGGSSGGGSSSTTSSSSSLSAYQKQKASSMTEAAQKAEFGRVVVPQTSTPSSSFNISSGTPITQSEKAAAAKRAASQSASQTIQTPQTSASITFGGGQFGGVGGGGSWSPSPSYSYEGSMKAGVIPSVYAKESMTKRDQTYEINQAKSYFATGSIKPYGEASKILTLSSVFSISFLISSLLLPPTSPSI